jgi:dipeptidyl aminopeptidase/acylaminoacyl peptidase
MRLTLVEHSDKQFTYSNKDKTLVSEASDLDNRHLERIYDDACDVGFAVKSDKTDSVVVFVMSSPIYHGAGEDREISGWEYEPANFSIRQHPECRGMKAVIFND